MSITLKRAKLLAESNPDILFFLSAETSGSSGWCTTVPVPIGDVIKRSEEAGFGDYVLSISPIFKDRRIIRD